MVKIDRGLRSDTASAFGYVIFGHTVVINSVDSDDFAVVRMDQLKVSVLQAFPWRNLIMVTA